MNTDRQIRVFISSTFRDMQAERDYLVKSVFPQLRKLCESRLVTWGEVDLRWGITDEQKAEGKVLPLCLEEIQRCRPYFIGLLGERYGWVPQRIPDDLIQRQPWLKSHQQQSVTELEIIHGVLGEDLMHGHGYFYFRDRRYLETLPPGVRSDFESETPETAAKLLQLKQRIRHARDEHVCKLREDYQDPQELGQWIVEDFTRLINQLFPENQTPNILDREAADHEAFAESRSRVYIGRQECFDVLDQHAASSEPAIVVLGESGSGKSALLANWAMRYRAAHPDDFLLMHFVGATPDSSDWVAMLRRIMGEFKRRFGFTQEIPDQPDALRAAFANWLHMAAAKGRVVIILDALNQLEDLDGAPDLIWLPSTIPANVRLFLSTLPGPSSNDLNHRGWPKFQVTPLGPIERTQLLTQYLAQYTKALDRTRTERIVAAPSCANPLYLRVLSEELRVFGSHERLDEQITNYLEARTVVELYAKVLARWEADYGSDTNLVSDAMTFLWAARRGLSEAELLDLLGADGLPLPGAHWSPLFLAAESALVNRSGLLNFTHQYLREAVRDKYLRDEQQQQRTHLRLADYFGGQQLTNRQINKVSLVDQGWLIKWQEEINLRRIDEQPWQLAEADDWQQLCALLADRDFLPRAWDQNQFEIKRYWARIEASSALRMTSAYGDQIVEPNAKADGNFLDVVALLLNDTGHPEQALQLRSALVESARADGNFEALQSCLGDQAAILMQRGELGAAMAAFREQEEICRRLNNQQGLQKSLGGQGLILFEQGKWDAAMALHKEEEKICRQLDDPHGVAISLNNQALIFYHRRELDEAMSLFKEEERMCRQLGDMDGLQHALGGQANVILESGHLDGVMDLYKSQERICRELGNQLGIAISLGNQTLVLERLGNFNGALALHAEEEQICRQINYRKGLGVSLGNQGVILLDLGRSQEALDRFKEEEQIFRELGYRLELARCLGNQAKVFLERGDAAGALNLYHVKEQIYRGLQNSIELGETLGYKAMILKKLGQWNEAMAALKEQEQICRQLNNTEYVAASLSNQALLFEGTERIAEGLELVEKAYRLALDHGHDKLAERINIVRERLRGGK